MSHVLKLKLALDVIGGGPLVLEVPEPRFRLRGFAACGAARMRPAAARSGPHRFRLFLLRR